MKELNRYFIGVDVGGSTIRVALFDQSFKDQSYTKYYLPQEPTPDLIVDQILEFVQESLDSRKIDSIDSIAAIGVGVAGQLSPTGRKIVVAPNLNWHNLAFAEIIETTSQRRFKKAPPVYLFNDLSALLEGESLFGAAKDHDNVFAVFLGTGLGSALKIDGKIYSGAAKVAGEIGHTKIEFGGRTCGCGDQGCVEAYISGRHLLEIIRSCNCPIDDSILQRLHLHIGDADASSLKSEDGVREPEITKDAILSQIGDHRLLQVLDHEVGLLANFDPPIDATHNPIYRLWDITSDRAAFTIANATTILNPELLLLGGGLFENLPTLKSMTLLKIDQLLPQTTKDALTITTAQLGADSGGVVGAASLARKAIKIRPPQ